MYRSQATGEEKGLISSDGLPLSAHISLAGGGRGMDTSTQDPGSNPDLWSNQNLGDNFGSPAGPALQPTGVNLFGQSVPPAYWHDPSGQSPSSLLHSSLPTDPESMQPLYQGQLSYQAHMSYPGQSPFMQSPQMQQALGSGQQPGLQPDQLQHSLKHQQLMQQPLSQQSQQQQSHQQRRMQHQQQPTSSVLLQQQQFASSVNTSFNQDELRNSHPQRQTLQTPLLNQKQEQHQQSYPLNFQQQLQSQHLGQYTPPPMAQSDSLQGQQPGPMQSLQQTHTQLTHPSPPPQQMSSPALQQQQVPPILHLPGRLQQPGPPTTLPQYQQHGQMQQLQQQQQQHSLAFSQPGGLDQVSGEGAPANALALSLERGHAPQNPLPVVSAMGAPGSRPQAVTTAGLPLNSNPTGDSQQQPLASAPVPPPGSFKGLAQSSHETLAHHIAYLETNQQLCYTQYIQLEYLKQQVSAAIASLSSGSHEAKRPAPPRKNMPPLFPPMRIQDGCLRSDSDADEQPQPAPSSSKRKTASPVPASSIISKNHSVDEVREGGKSGSGVMKDGGAKKQPRSANETEAVSKTDTPRGQAEVPKAAQPVAVPLGVKPSDSSPGASKHNKQANLEAGDSATSVGRQVKSKAFRKRSGKQKKGEKSRGIEQASKNQQEQAAKLKVDQEELGQQWQVSPTPGLAGTPPTLMQYLPAPPRWPTPPTGMPPGLAPCQGSMSRSIMVPFPPAPIVGQLSQQLNQMLPPSNMMYFPPEGAPYLPAPMPPPMPWGMPQMPLTSPDFPTPPTQLMPEFAGTAPPLQDLYMPSTPLPGVPGPAVGDGAAPTSPHGQTKSGQDNKQPLTAKESGVLSKALNHAQRMEPELRERIKNALYATMNTAYVLPGESMDSVLASQQGYLNQLMDMVLGVSPVPQDASEAQQLEELRSQLYRNHMLVRQQQQMLAMLSSMQGGKS